MSSRITIKSTPALATGGLISILVGILMIIGGGVAWAMVSQQLANERIYVSEDAPFLANQLVNNPIAAFSQAEAINTHALEASGGKTYSELSQDDPLRATVMNAAFLRSSLFTSVVSFGVSLLAIGTGAVFFIIGWALRRSSISHPIVVETDNGGVPQIENTRGKILQQGDSSVLSDDLVEPAGFAAVPSTQAAGFVSPSTALGEDPRASAQAASTASPTVAAPASPQPVSAVVLPSVAQAIAARGSAPAKVDDSTHAANSNEAPAPSSTSVRSAHSSTSAASSDSSVSPVSAQSPATPDATTADATAPDITAGATPSDTSASAPAVFEDVRQAQAHSPLAQNPTGAIPVVRKPPTSSLGPIPAGITSAGTSPAEGGSEAFWQSMRAAKAPTRIPTAEARSNKPATFPTPAVQPPAGTVPAAPAQSSASALSARSAYTGATPVVPAAATGSADSDNPTFAPPRISAQTAAMANLPTRSSRSARSARSAVSAATGAIPKIPSFDELISPTAEATSRSERILNDSRKRIEDEKSRSGMTGTIPIVGSSSGSAQTPSGAASPAEGAGSPSTAGDERPIAGAVSWQSPEDRLK